MNKTDERTLVERVYALDRTWRIRDAESPDFLCEVSGRTILGIEVTEYHYSQTYARLHHIPSYVENLLDGMSIRHKADKILKITEIEIQDKDGNPKHKGVKAIVQEIPPVAERIELLAELIDKKNRKCLAYLLSSTVGSEAWNSRDLKSRPH